MLTILSSTQWLVESGCGVYPSWPAASFLGLLEPMAEIG